MRFVAAVKVHTNADGFVQFSFPGAGVLKNISFQLYNALTEIPDQDNWRVALGNINRLNIQDQTPLVDSAFSQVQSSRAKDLIVIQGLDFQDSRANASSVNTYHYFYHSNKTLRVRNDTIYTLGVFGKPTSNSFWILVQGEYYPYSNSYMKFTYSFDDVDDDSNFANEVVIPTGLKNAVIEYEAYVSDNEDTEIAARVVPRIIRRNEYDLDSLGGDGGVIDGVFATTGDVRYGNTVDGFIIGTSKSGLASSQGVLPIRDIIRAGDKITFDIINLKGDITDAETFKLTIVVHGRATGEPTKTKSHFLDSNWWIQPTPEMVE